MTQLPWGWLLWCQQGYNQDGTNSRHSRLAETLTWHTADAIMAHWRRLASSMGTIAEVELQADQLWSIHNLHDTVSIAFRSISHLGFKVSFRAASSAGWPVQQVHWQVMLKSPENTRTLSLKAPWCGIPTQKATRSLLVVIEWWRLQNWQIGGPPSLVTPMGYSFSVGWLVVIVIAPCCNRAVPGCKVGIEMYWCTINALPPAARWKI